jgi:WXG100 family type VII secretion target
MSARIVRADYDQLAQMASAFAQQAALARQMLQQLSKQSEVLQGGDWLGQGAQAFYSEMNSQVLPTMNRLVRALEAAGDVTRQINQIAQQAEAEAAACLRVNGNGNGAGATIGAAAASLGLNGGGVAAGPAGSGASALFGGPAGPKAGGGAPAKTLLGRLADADPKLAGAVNQNKPLVAKLNRLEREGWVVEVVKDLGGATHSITPGQPPKLTVAAKTAPAGLAHLNEAANEILYGDIKLMQGLDPKLAAQAMDAPILMEQLRQLDKMNWSVEMSKEAGHSAISLGRKHIVLDPQNPLASLRDSVSGAVRGEEQAEKPGFELSNRDVNWDPTTVKDGTVAGHGGGGRGLYVAQNTDYRLQHDALELISRAQAHQAAYGKLPDNLPFTPPGVVSPRSEQYKALVQAALNGTRTKEDAAMWIAQLYRVEPSNIGNNQKYRDEYMARFDAWAANNPNGNPPQRPR